MSIDTTYEIVPLPSGGTIMAAVHEGECFFSPRHVCEELGIDWKSQYRKIDRDPVLRTYVVIMTTRLPGDTQARSYYMLPIPMLSGWLFTIKKVAPEIQAKLNLYRAEGFLALDTWFRQGMRQDQEVQQKIEVPKTLAEALRAYADQVEETERLKAVVDETLPKAALVDAHYHALNKMTVAQFARTLDGVNSNKIKAALKHHGVLYVDGKGRYRVYSRFRDTHFVEKRNETYGSIDIYPREMGRNLIIKLYRSGKLVMKKGHEDAWKEEVWT